MSGVKQKNHHIKIIADGMVMFVRNMEWMYNAVINSVH